MDVSCRQMRKDDFTEAVVIAQKSINDTDPLFYEYVKNMTDSLGAETEGGVPWQTAKSSVLCFLSWECT